MEFRNFPPLPLRSLLPPFSVPCTVLTFQTLSPDSPILDLFLGRSTNSNGGKEAPASDSEQGKNKHSNQAVHAAIAQQGASDIVGDTLRMLTDRASVAAVGAGAVRHVGGPDRHRLQHSPHDFDRKQIVRQSIRAKSVTDVDSQMLARLDESYFLQSSSGSTLGAELAAGWNAACQRIGVASAKPSTPLSLSALGFRTSVCVIEAKLSSDEI
eukprot:1891269-Rhodomonas_salina.1